MPKMSTAFALQAASDLAAYEVLSSTETALPRCHRLHYLQMWLEKLCKAHVHGSNLPVDSFSHGVIAKVLPRLIAQYWRSLDFKDRPNLSEISALCREIDLLQPPVKAGGRREDNVEYPWCSAAWFERTASTAMVKAIYRFKTDRISVADEFEVDADWRA